MYELCVVREGSGNPGVANKLLLGSTLSVGPHVGLRRLNGGKMLLKVLSTNGNGETRHQPKRYVCDLNGSGEVG